MNETPDYQLSITEAMKIASSPEGQQLIALLKQNKTAELQNAINMATAGNISGAKALLSSLLQDPETKTIVDQITG